MCPELPVNKKAELLQDRAEMLRRSRLFFEQRGVIEVDCPILSKKASVDVHIDLFKTLDVSATCFYLHSSPEYGMKKLLAEGSGDIYQISHVFRYGESGKKHNPEFMMAEWYRLGISFSDMIGETVDFIRLFVGELSFLKMTYRKAFERYAGIDYLSATIDELQRVLSDKGIIIERTTAKDRDDLLNLILELIIRPRFDADRIVVLQYFPATQAALARIKIIGKEPVAERFEVFYKGMELANGYHELADPKEQRRRLLAADRIRKKLGKESLPIDESFIESLAKLPDCCGVAVGFDRLMMARRESGDIADVLPLAGR